MTHKGRAVVVGVPHHICGENRFFSCSLEEPYFLNTVRYIERNPIRAKMLRKALRYPWSSAAVHVVGQDPSGLLSFSQWPAYYRGERWKRQLQDPEEDRMIGRIRDATFKGRPLGSDRFISKLETLLGRRLRPAPMGRPRKKAKTNKKRNEKW